MIENSLSRRSFLAGAGIVTGAAVVAAGTGLIKPKSAFGHTAVPALPWGYSVLNSTEIAALKQNAYNLYYSPGGCMIGTGRALIEAIMTKLGSGTEYDKWQSFPKDLFTYGAGGVSSWGTICGALHGAAYVISACAPDGTVATNVINTLYQWYCSNPFPSTDHDGYLATTGIASQPTSVCYSPLCHASVSTWCTANAKKVSSYDKKDRCAKVAADVAGKTAALLNDYFVDNAYTATFVQPDSTCSGCHVNTSANGTDEHWVQMKADCDTCHGAGKNTDKPVGSTCTRI